MPRIAFNADAAAATTQAELKMSHLPTTMFFISIRVLGYALIGLMGVTILYACIIAILNWTQIAV